MKEIQRKNFVLAALTCFGILTVFLFLALGEDLSEIRGQIFLAVLVILSAVSAGFWIREFSKLKIARLIEENPILHIRTAVISELSAETRQRSNAESTQVVISYFGILLNGKVIKFNQDGIRIRAAEIGDDFISFTYGTEKRTHNIRLLRPAIDSVQLEEIAEKFRYETGITPTLQYKGKKGK